MPPLPHVCNGLALPADESMLSQNIGTIINNSSALEALLATMNCNERPIGGRPVLKFFSLTDEPTEFLSRISTVMLTRDIDSIVCLSVRSSVRLSCCGIVSKWLNILSSAHGNPIILFFYC